MDDSIVAKTKHAEVTLDQLAEIQPGMARIMDELAKRYHHLYYAAKGGNWQLAAHQLNEVRATMRIAKVTRPKYSEDLDAFDREYLHLIEAAIRERNWEKFDEAYHRGIEGSDKYHDKYGKNHIRFTLPPDPPKHLYLGPPEKFSRERKTPTS